MPLQPAYTSNELISPKKKKGCRSCQSKPARKGTRIVAPKGPLASTKAGGGADCPGCKKRQRRTSGKQPTT